MGWDERFLTLFYKAPDERITTVAGVARTDGVVVYYLAAGILSTNTRTGIDAFRIDTSQSLPTV